MNLKRLNWIVILSLSIIVIPAENKIMAKQTVCIGNSNRADATALSNGRRIARTQDDYRIVVFQDSIMEHSVIKWTVSSDGVNWFEPALLDQGSDPAVTILHEDDDYFTVIWVAEDKRTLKTAAIGKNGTIHNLVELLTPDNAVECRYPGITSSGDNLYYVWQQSNIAEQTAAIIACCNGDEIVQLSRVGYESKFPTMESEIEFESGSVHFMWTEYSATGDSSRIMYCYAKDVADCNFQANLVSPIILPNSRGKMLPSISVRKSSLFHDGLCNIIAAYGSKQNNWCTIAHILLEKEWFSHVFTDSVRSTPNPMPSVDDILMPPATSCAIVWQDSGKLYYGQTDNQRIITNPPILIQEADDAPQMYPNVCYKTFRPDSFDVVWTQGIAVPYKIMYQRRAKQYPKLFFTGKELPDGKYKNYYYGLLHINGGLGNIYTKVISGNLPPGLWAGTTYVEGFPEKSGVYNFILQVSDDSPASSDTASFRITITNSKPLITAPDSITITTGVSMAYTAQATDPETNEIAYSFINYPSWLMPVDQTISGTAPLVAGDTSFVVIASDGELADTLLVNVRIKLPTDIKKYSDNGQPSKSELLQNYPNPFNSSTTIHVLIKEDGFTTLSICNQLGQEVKILIRDMVRAGNCTVIWDATNTEGFPVNSGLYFLCFKAQNICIMKKILYVR